MHREQLFDAYQPEYRAIGMPIFVRGKKSSSCIESLTSTRSKGNTRESFGMERSMKGRVDG